MLRIRYAHEVNKPERFQRVSAKVQAMQWTGDNTSELWDWVGPFMVGGINPSVFVAELKIWFDLKTNDWIIKDSGGFTVVDETFFQRFYAKLDRLFPESTIADCMAVAVEVATANVN